MKAGSSSVPVPGWNVSILDTAGHFAAPNEVQFGILNRSSGISTLIQMGDIAIGLPLPPGAATTLWNDDERYINSYLKPLPGHYATADAGFQVESTLDSDCVSADIIMNCRTRTDMFMSCRARMT